MIRALLILIGGGVGAAWAAPIQVTDDAGHVIKLAAPARRIISLAPHITELVYAAGAGKQLVAVSAYSDYPAAAAKLPQVADYNGLAIEQIVALKPDLVIAWHSGTSPKQVAKLESLGLPVFWSRPAKLPDVAKSIEVFGVLAGTEPVAQKAAVQYRQQLDLLAKRYRGRPAIRVFYPIWDKPLTTVNRQHLISDVIALCGGTNIFGGLPNLTPLVSPESVMAGDPEVILEAGREDVAQSDWLRWPSISAVRHGNIHAVPASLISRPSPRIIEGAMRICETLEAARARRAGAKAH
ncbi:iron complex transport system substrate-binding protein [Chitinivorax tropicus]|uniref:Iron complex transport system substrate-binding protein n=1 Tax=Chitinivorax tropicus TaxID=714531 RepID=A0A840MRN8_9PROT|nr:cobalamin-binding protein [Chitinivorax tropicus]MBB5019777.1 iron complex transport system substrate-binding protein [Chitinivorax tropicus]